jgi:predicted nucleic acid-binding protein
LIVFDASSIVSAALKADSIPERALLQAEEVDVFALSAAVDTEIAEVLNRPKFARAISRRRRERFLRLMRAMPPSGSIRLHGSGSAAIRRTTNTWNSPWHPAPRRSSAATMICSCSIPGAAFGS